MTLWALARVGHRDTAFLSAAALSAASLVQQLNMMEVDSCLWALASLDMGGTPSTTQFFGDMAAALLQWRGGDALPESVKRRRRRSSAAGGGGDGGKAAGRDQAQPQARRWRRGGRQRWLWIARNGHRHPRRWCHAQRLPAQQLAAVMWSYARAGHVDEDLFEALATRTTRLLNASSVLRREAAGAGGRSAQQLAACKPVALMDFSAASIARLLWAFAMVGMHEGPLLQQLAHRARQLLPRFEPRDVAGMAWALVTARVPGCEDLVVGAAQAAVRHAHAFTPWELSAIARAVATTRGCSLQLLRCCADMLLQAAGSAQQSSGGKAPGWERASLASGRGLQVVADVVWAHAASRVYEPRLLQHAGLMAAQLLERHAAEQAPAASGAARPLGLGPGAAADSYCAPPPPAPSANNPPVDPSHLASLLQAYAVWGSYHARLFAAAGAALLADGGRVLEELGTEDVVTLAWAYAMVLHAMGPPLPTPQGGDRADGRHAHSAEPADAQQQQQQWRHQQQAVEILARLSQLLRATRPDSFLHPELRHLAQAQAASAEWARAAAPARTASATTSTALDANESPAAAGAHKQPLPRHPGPLALGPRLLGLVGPAWSSAAGQLACRRAVAELCSALERAGCTDIRVGTHAFAAGHGGLPVPFDVAACLPAAGQGGQPSGLAGDDGVVGRGGDDAGLRPHVAFLLAVEELHSAAPQPAARQQQQQLLAPVALQVRALQARGWRVATVGVPPPGVSWPMHASALVDAAVGAKD